MASGGVFESDNCDKCFLSSHSRRRNWIFYFAKSSTRKFPPQDENWKIKENERKIQSISNIFSQAFESLFVLCSFIAARIFLSSFDLRFHLFPSHSRSDGEDWGPKNGAAKRTTTKRWGKKTNFMAFSWLYFLGKIVLFMSLRYIKLFLFLCPFSSSFFYWKIMSFVYEKQRQEFEIYIGFFIGVSFLYFLNSIQVQMLNSRKLIPWYFARISTTWLRDARSTTLSEL